jgi:hypothetical protein
MESRTLFDLKLAFISGPYRADTVVGIVENIRRAEAVAKKYWLLGYVVICPHMNTALFDGLLPDEAWLMGALEILVRCNTIVMMEGWEDSSGAKEELRYAKKWDKEIIYEKE